MPQNKEEWERVIDRIDLNFGGIFSSLSKESLILDVACGVGYLEDYLLRKGFTRVKAIDISEEQIQMAKKNLSKQGHQWNNKIEFQCVDVFNYLEKNNGYKLIAVFDFLDHLGKNEVIKFLGLCNNALEDNGILILRVTNAESPMFSRSFYADITHETGFTHTSIRQCLSIANFKVISSTYEKTPKDKIKGFWFLKMVKRSVRSLLLKILANLLGISVEAFSEDLTVVAKK